LQFVTSHYGGQDFSLVQALRNSIKSTCGTGAKLEILRPDDVNALDRFRGKIQALRDRVVAGEDGEELLLLDADTFVLRNPAEVFGDAEFDIAHCPRPGRFPTNTGVVFVRVNDRTRRFVDAWMAYTLAWGESEKLVAEAAKQSGGTDQAGFEQALAAETDAVVAELPYLEWNCCQDFEQAATDRVGILHLKGKWHKRLLKGQDTDLPAWVLDAWARFKPGKRWDEILRRLPGPQTDRPPVMAEVGVWRGACSSNVLSRHATVRMYLVDTWRAPEPGSSYADSGDQLAALNQENFDDALERTKRATRSHGARCVIVRQPSLRAAKMIRPGLDLVFIDADHSYEGCQADIEAWRGLVRDGGWLGGHDIDHEQFPKWNVGQAVREFVEREGCRLELGDDHTWFVRITK